MAQENAQKRPGRRRRTLGLLVASTVATAPLGCDDGTNPPVDPGGAMAAVDAAASGDAAEMEDAPVMDTGSQLDSIAASDSATDTGDAGDAAQEYPAGVRG